MAQPGGPSALPPAGPHDRLVVNTPGGPTTVDLRLLTPDEQALVRRGEIDQSKYALGGLMGTWVGFGVGHGVQGRWSDIGWVFTVGETAAFSALIAGMVVCLNDEDLECGPGAEALLIGGAVTMVGMRLWEIIDVWTGADSYNARVRAAVQKGTVTPPRYGFFAIPRATPGRGTTGGLAGFAIRF